MKPLPLINGAFFTSGSFLERIETCDRSAEYYKLDARVGTTNANAQSFGKHLHTALEAHYKLREYPLNPHEIATRVSQILQEGFQLVPIENDELRTVNWALEIYEQFAKKYAQEPFKVMQYEKALDCKHCDGQGENFIPVVAADPDDRQTSEPCLWCNGTGKTSIMTEVPFVCKLYEHTSPALGTIPVYYHGFIDLPMLKAGNVYVRDYKTAIRLGESYWLEKKMSMQPKGYAWAWEQLTGQKVHGYNIVALRTSKPTKAMIEGKVNRKGENKTLESFWDESIADQTYFIAEGELEEWKENAVCLIEEFFHYYIKGYFPKKTQWCSGKYGKCQYVEVCETFPVSERASVLASGLYKDKEPTIIQ